MPKKENTQNNVMINELVRNISSAMELFMTNLRKIDFSKLVNNLSNISFHIKYNK